MNAHLAIILPVRLAYNVNGYGAGQVLAPNASTPPLFSAYSSVSGSQNANCILFDAIDPLQFISPTGTAMGRGIFGGQVYQGNLIDYNSTVLTSLNGKLIMDANGINILKF
jgi:hypothetical protein